MKIATGTRRLGSASRAIHPYGICELVRNSLPLAILCCLVMFVMDEEYLLQDLADYVRCGF